MVRRTICGASRLVRLALGGLFALSLANVAAAQDTAEDHGSRATKEGGGGVKLGTTYDLGAFGGYYAQGDEFGGMFVLGLEQSIRKKRHEVTFGAGYLFDSFSTKTFNFPEEDQFAQPARIVQPAHQIDTGVKLETRWSKLVSTKFALGADLLLPQLDLDHRGRVEAVAQLRVGRKRGLYTEVDAQYSYKRYPNYRVSDRSIDQQALESVTEFGYSLSKLGEIALGYYFEFTDYIDARYDQMLPGGSIARAEVSKDYLLHAPFASVSFRPSSRVRVRLVGKLQINDARHYDWNVLGLGAGGVSDYHFIRDYYDYLRPRAELTVKVKPTKTLVLRTMGEVWTRDFANYEARDEQNFWTGELRSDVNIEVGLEGNLRVAKFGPKRRQHEVWLVAFGSHLYRRSNMKREISLATNFDVTRVFVGAELHGP